MQVVSNSMLIAFDVDKTLILRPDTSGKPYIEFCDPYTGHKRYRIVHRPHLRLLKNYLARGAFVVVWSKNGGSWAEVVLRSLGIDIESHSNLLVTPKPFAYVDDQDAVNWMGYREFMDPDDEFGQEEF